MYNALLKVIILLCLLIFVWSLILLFSIILNVSSSLAVSLGNGCSNRVYDVKSNRSAKQLSLVPELRSVGIAVLLIGSI